MRDLNFFYGHNFFSNFIDFFFPKSISEFQKWTFINVQKSILQNNLGFSKYLNLSSLKVNVFSLFSQTVPYIM